MGITFFTALWILYVARCALHAAAYFSLSMQCILEMLSTFCNSSMQPQANFNLVLLPPESDSLVTQVDICGAKWPSGSHRPELNVLHILLKIHHFSYKIIPNTPCSIMVLYCVFPLPSPAHPGVATRFA